MVKSRMRHVAVGAVLLLVGALSACGAEPQSVAQADADDTGLLQPGELAVGLDLTYAPYSYLEGETPVGFDVEVLRLIAEDLGLTPDFRDTRFEQVIIGVSSGQFDLTPGLYMTPERAEEVALVPYFSAGSAIVTRTAGGPSPVVEEDLCGLRISSIKGGAVVGKVLTETNALCSDLGEKPVDVREYPTDPEATQALLSGGVDVQLTEAIIAKEVVEKSNGQLKISSDELLYPVQVGWGVEKNNEALIQALTQALARIDSSGEYGELLESYGLQRHDPDLATRAVRGDEQ